MNRAQDSAFNARLRLIFAALEDGRRECTREEWRTLRLLVEQRLAYLGGDQRRAA
jgi:hypothetical protein